MVLAAFRQLGTSHYFSIILSKSKLFSIQVLLSNTVVRQMGGSRICNGICCDLRWIPLELLSALCNTGLWPEAALYLIDVSITTATIKKAML